MSRPWKLLTGAVLVGSVLMSLILPGPEWSRPWYLPGFWAVYGFAGFFLLIYVAKALGNHWLYVDPDYYEPHRAPREVGEVGADQEESSDA